MQLHYDYKRLRYSCENRIKNFSFNLFNKVYNKNFKEKTFAFNKII